MKLLLHIFALLLLFVFMSACKESERQKAVKNDIRYVHKICMDEVISIDSSLGSIRNHACETASLSEAITSYASGLETIDFDSCPEGFEIAFRKHKEAWLALLPIAEKYPEMRGEMHDLFDQLEKRKDSAAFEPLLKAVHATWGEVEAAMKQ